MSEMVSRDKDFFVSEKEEEETKGEDNAIVSCREGEREEEIVVVEVEVEVVLFVILFVVLLERELLGGRGRGK